MKAAMPVPYIIALIIGVIVVALLAYWFISSGGKGIAIGPDAECNARKIEFCTAQTEDAWYKIQEKCGNFDKCYNYCSSIIPGWKALPQTLNSHAECKPPT